MSLSTSFLLFTLAVAAVVAGVVYRYLPREQRAIALAALAGWMVYAAVAGLVLEAKQIQPAAPFYGLPLVAWIVILTRTNVGRVLSLSVPLTVLTGLQVFRLFVELYLDGLWKVGLVPRTMTFHGANYDIVIAVSAPVVTWLIARRTISWKALVAWNVLGLGLLANVVARGILSAPGPWRMLVDDVPNRAIGVFPFSFIAGLMVMLAATLHIVSIRKLRYSRATMTTEERT